MGPKSWNAMEVAHKEVFDESVKTVRSAESKDTRSMNMGDCRRIWPINII